MNICNKYRAISLSGNEGKETTMETDEACDDDCDMGRLLTFDTDFSALNMQICRDILMKNVNTVSRAMKSHVVSRLEIERSLEHNCSMCP
jgi:hypothetical protein